MSSLKKKVALVTGGSSGIGKALVSELLAQGCVVASCARRVDQLKKVSDSENLLALQVDLRSEKEILKMFAHIQSKLGGVDILINNAGLGHEVSLIDGPTESWREMLDVNVLALSICTREAVKQMQNKQNTGHIIHVGSMAGHRVPSIAAFYSATKFAVRALTEGLRQELRAAKSSIRVGEISPGVVETEFLDKYFNDKVKAKQVYSGICSLQATDVARAVVYMLQQPKHVEVHDILMRPTEQNS